ncbi:MAG: hypothetical protein ACOC1F_04350 [Myxococcota bacterium]
MADYYAVILDLSTSIFEYAKMEVCSSSSGSVTFTVYTSGGSSSSASESFNSDLYADSGDSSMPNLFAPASGESALVRASSSVGTGAFLRQWSGDHSVGYFVPPTTASVGSDFYLPSTAHVTTAKVLIGNPNSSSVTVSLYYGSSGTPSSNHAIGARKFAIVTLSNTEDRVRLRTSSGSFFVQLAVEVAGDYDISFVTPA